LRASGSEKSNNNKKKRTNALEKPFRTPQLFTRERESLVLDGE
jgi:hypothetical protein